MQLLDEELIFLLTGSRAGWVSGKFS